MFRREGLGRPYVPPTGRTVVAPCSGASRERPSSVDAHQSREDGEHAGRDAEASPAAGSVVGLSSIALIGAGRRQG